MTDPVAPIDSPVTDPLGPSIPPLEDQVEENGTWRAAQYSPITGGMTWEPTGPGFARLNDQVHDEGTWSSGPGCSMTWTPIPTDDPSTEEPVDG
jgi:hypothetical protein